MKAWIMVLKIFGYIWLTFAVMVIGASILWIWIKEGFSEVQEILSPFNVINWAVTLIALAPGLGALMWAAKLEKKRKLRA